MKTVLITGASKGLGKELAREFHRSGWSVALVARSVDTLEGLAEELRVTSASTEQSIHIMPGDLLDPELPGRLFKELRRRWRGLSALVNNAGIQGPIGMAWECGPQEWEDAFKVLLHAPVALCRLAVPWLAEGGGGAIVNVSGGGASGPRPRFSAYAAAKTALVRFTETLAAECRDMGIRVNAVAPGIMPSDILRHIVKAGQDSAGEKEFAAAMKSLSQTGTEAFRPAVECIHFLCDTESTEISGRLVSAAWDNYRAWPEHAKELCESDLYTLRRITGRERGVNWGDKC